MKCEYCDQEIKENETICSHCSAPIKQPLNKEDINSENSNQSNTIDIDTNPQIPSGGNNKKNAGSDKKAFKILLPIVAVIVFIVGIIAIFSLNKKDEFKEKKEEISSSIFDYDSVPYAYADDSIVENTTKRKTSQSRTTERKETTTRSYESTNQVTLPQITRKTTQATITTRPATTTTKPVQTNKKISRTIMIYMVGSNLESQYGEATQDIFEMSEAYLDDYTNVYVYTGGANKWQNNYINSTNNGIYEVKNGYIYSIADDGNKNMGLSSTLSGFINFIEKNTNSEYYDLILWNHGGGPINGFGNDEKTNDYLEIEEIEEALKNTSFNKNNKLEFIGFDACLMASLEVALFLDDYAEYLVASEETESGIGWYYKSLENASNLDTISFTKQIINGFAQDNKIYELYYPNTPYTLSLIDLDNVTNLAKTVNSSTQTLQREIEKNYEQYAKYRVDSLEFGKNTSTSSFDLIDLYAFASNAQINSIITEVENTVIYSSSNLKNAHGISIYFPFTNEDYISNNYLNYYASYKELTDYCNFLKNFIKIKSGTKRNDISIEDNDLAFSKTNNQLSLTLSEDEINNVAASQYIVFKKEDDNNFTPVYRGNNVIKVGNKLIAEYNNKLIYVSENGESAPLQVIQSKTTSRGTLFLAPVVLLNVTNNFKVDSGYAQVYVKNDDIQFAGITSLPDVTSNKNMKNQSDAKIQWQLGEWEFAHFTNYRYNILDDKGHYTMNWKPLEQKYLFEVSPQKNKVEFILKDMDPNEEYYMVFNIKDYQGNITSSNLLKIR